ncbi:MAG: EscU/YscU/HrcU family type III secretion system export apparatus switch protein [Gammaproteobacteria bacterium]|nr:EscU/YscU/HrcU family type III secretion system export apparatus switch protein [Gammaproteobacteria bacterium]
MAEQTGQERTEQATPRRLQQAREKGQIPNSRELNTLLMLILAGAALWLIGPYAAKEMSLLIKNSLHLTREQIFDPVAMPSLFKEAIFDALAILAPFFVIMVVASVAGPISLGGGLNISTEAISLNGKNWIL